MINDVRNTVLAILNKENRGSITPDQFNLYAKKAQLEIFEQYFHDYSIAVNRMNKQLHSSGYADIPKRIAEAIDFFTADTTLTFSTPFFDIPADTYSLGTVVYNTVVEVDKISNNKIFDLLGSIDTSPSTDHPVYVVRGNQIQVYPTTIQATVTALRSRYPADPKWTYVSFTDGEPLFNQSANDFQDFEVPKDDLCNLVAKICQYSGVQIREAIVVKYMKGEEVQEKQEQK